ncbi:hypothetical protein [Inquilinus sp. OTU3971]|uniref:hypothetical protein n=1 Tax=Inquilinus sp. OTU3971 TaxID=3043855 RepID=UPI00313BBD6A
MAISSIPLDRFETAPDSDDSAVTAFEAAVSRVQMARGELEQQRAAFRTSPRDSEDRADLQRVRGTLSQAERDMRTELANVLSEGGMVEAKELVASHPEAGLTEPDIFLSAFTVAEEQHLGSTRMQRKQMEKLVDPRENEKLVDPRENEWVTIDPNPVGRTGRR